MVTKNNVDLPQLLNHIQPIWHNRPILQCGKELYNKHRRTEKESEEKESSHGDRGRKKERRGWENQYWWGFFALDILFYITITITNKLWFQLNCTLGTKVTYAPFLTSHARLAVRAKTRYKNKTKKGEMYRCALVQQIHYNWIPKIWFPFLQTLDYLVVLSSRLIKTNLKSMKIKSSKAQYDIRK